MSGYTYGYSTTSPALESDLEYDVNTTTATICLTVLSVSILATTIGLYREHSKQSKSTCEVHCGVGLSICFYSLMIICVLYVFSFPDTTSTYTFGSYSNGGFWVLFLARWIWMTCCIKLWYSKEYFRFSRNCWHTRIPPQKVIIAIEKANIIDFQPFGHPKYLYLRRYTNSGNVKEKEQEKEKEEKREEKKEVEHQHGIAMMEEYVFWKLDASSYDVQYLLNRRTAAISFLLTFVLALFDQVYYGILWYCYLMIPFIVYDTWVTNRLAKWFWIGWCLSAAIKYYILVLYGLQDSDNEVLESKNELSYNSVSHVIDAFILLIMSFWSYVIVLILSKRELYNTAAKLLVSQITSTFDLMTDIIIIVIWINSGDYVWAVIQICIILLSEWIVLYLMVFDKKKYDSTSLDDASLCELFMIFVGLDKLWFAIKKLSPGDHDKNDIDHDHDHDFEFEMVKLWELLFESIPTLVLASYILLVSPTESQNLSVIISMIVSMCNVSLTMIKAIRFASKHRQQVEQAGKQDDKQDKQAELKREISLIASRSPSLSAANDNSLNGVTTTIDIGPSNGVHSSGVTAENVDTKVQEPRWKQIDFSKIERPYVPSRSGTRKNCCTRNCCQLKNMVCNNFVFFCRYFMIWLFSASDLYVRIVPPLMIVSFINVEYKNKIVTSLIAIIFWICAYIYEFYVMNSQLIVKREKEMQIELQKSASGNNKNNNNAIVDTLTKNDNAERINIYHNRIVNLIYSFYSVFSNGLYLMVLIELPYLQFIQNDSKYFIKYQCYRIGVSFIMLIIILIWDSVENNFDHYFDLWTYIGSFAVFLVHVISFRFVSTHLFNFVDKK